MPFIDPDALPVVEPRPGWRGRFFHSENMTFAYYEIAPDASVHAHRHPEEEVWHVLDGDVEITLDGSSSVVRPGQAVVVPRGARHEVRALTAARVIVVDHPVRTTVGGVDTGAR